jgi:hypothetical protein
MIIADYTHLNYKTSLEIMKEPWNSQKITKLNGTTMFSTQEPQCKFSVTNQMDKDLPGDPANTGIRLTCH